MKSRGICIWPVPKKPCVSLLTFCTYIYKEYLMTNHNDNDIVFCSPLRTPVGRYGGVFRDIPVEDLATTVVDAIVESTGLGAQDVDHIILDQGHPNGAATAIGRPGVPNSARGKE